MVAVEAAIAKIFIDVAVSTGVDVLSKRAANPVIRGAAHAHKVYSLVSSIEGVYSAIRISAYSDAARLIGHEAVVQVGSQNIARTLLRISEANYEVHRKAERYLLTPEYAVTESTHPLCGWLYSNLDFAPEDVAAFGRPLATQTGICVGRAIRARDIATELVSYSEARTARRYRNWDRSPNWVDRINTDLGHMLWRPLPEIGLGMRPVAHSATYFGIFRRDDPEGYGCIRWLNGTQFFGQTRHGFPRGYGVFYFNDGRVYCGKVDAYKHLGASISPKRDWVFYGEHQDTTPDGYGRRVGIANGVESVSAFWDRGELRTPFQSMADVHNNIASGMDGQHLIDLRMEYQRNADNAERALAMSDASVLSHLSGHL
jgi:hypothetical protein